MTHSDHVKPRIEEEDVVIEKVPDRKERMSSSNENNGCHY